MGDSGHGTRLPRVPSVFCPTPAVVAVARHLPALVLLRAPRGYGKTSTVAYWLRSGEFDDRAVAWLTLSDRTGVAELWAAVHDALVAAGVASPAAAPDLDTVDQALRRLTRRLVLVIDGLHQVTDVGVDPELVELAQVHELLHLVVTTRLVRPILSIGPATVDAAVLDIADLRLTPAEGALLAGRLGLSLSQEEIADILAAYAGWPALVRAALLEARRAGDGRLVTDAAAIARYTALIVRDQERAEWRDVLTALAVPDPLRPGDLDVLVDEPTQLPLADVVVESSYTDRRPDGTTAYPPGLRQALLENLRSDSPDRFRDLNGRLARRRREQRLAGEALIYAMRAEAWPLVLGILEDHWAELLGRHSDAVQAAVRAMPRELVASSARLVVARDYVLDRDTRHQAEAALRSGLLTPGGPLPVRTLTTTQRLALRFDGTPAFGAAQILLGRLDSALADGGHPQHSPEVERAIPELLTQWALSMLHANDGVRAAYGFALACQEAVRLGNSAAAREAAHGTALAMALLGHTRSADAWSTYGDGLAAAPTPLEVVARPLARTVLAGMRLARSSWPSVPTLSGEHGLAPLLELTRVAAAFADILHGRFEHARVVLQRHATDHGHDQPELVRASVTALRVDLALAEGRLDRAGALLASVHDDAAWTRASRARHAFYVGAYAETLRLTEDGATFAGTRPRAGLELLLLHACAAWRAGQREAAVDDLATAVGLAADTEVLLPFLTVPRSDLEAIAPDGSWARQFLDEPRLVHTDTVFPEPLRAGQLSVAELRVLRELRADVPLAHIGRRLYLSESTVKTHVRRIYRKLGVSDRTHALERARELSLLDGD
ncbi:LuxR C-terminal-related transcriptional regulator [Georgenia satyanarayanai]|uniref:LuxR C-terminal-related transcriptional regulator n=1 Tax=Georgenia satyanarayanai TaxID=860221 RepID=UPI001264C67E|nr:LuxR C-terminal-related transcriptional regulator [Georgenia satyanarayanai]